MDNGIIARPLVTVTSAIWSFNTELHRPQLLLIKRADEPLEGHWVLPETLLQSKKSANAACTCLIDNKIGLQVPMNSTEQLAAFTDPKRVTGTWALAFAYMAYLPSTPKLHSGYGATDAQWSVLDKGQGSYVVTHDQREIILSLAGHLVFDHIRIITTAINRAKNKLDYQPQVPRVLGNIFTLCQVCEVFATFLGTTVDKIDNSNFKKTHSHLLKEIGAATLNHSGRPPKFY